MRNFFIALVLMSITPSLVSAQCNRANRTGYHIVQPGDNLYRISLKYGVKMAQVCAWNNIKIDQVLPSCKELRISPTVSSYARLTSAQSSEFEARGTSTYTPTPRATPVSSNYSPRPSTKLTPEATTDNKTSVASPMAANRQTGKRHTVQHGESLESIAETYGFTAKRLREINVMRGDEKVTEGSILLTSDCTCEILPRTTVHSKTGGHSNAIGKASEYSNKGTSSHSNNKHKTNHSNKNSTKSKAAFMQSEEQAMVDEINLLRSNPGAYAKYVRAYVEKGENGKGFPTDAATVGELYAELNRTGPLSQLQVTECIYNAARKHGIDQLSQGKSGHVGSDGSYPWDRVVKACPQMREGGENLVGGPNNVRDAVIMLLIDQGIANRGHRRALLNKDWKYVACYKVGKIGSMPNSWVQNFAY